MGLQMPSYPYMNGGRGGKRVDSVPPNGGVPGSYPAFMSEQYWDPFRVEYGILTGEFYGVGTLPDAHYAAVLSSAYNDYTRDHLPDRDDRFRGSITIPKQQPLLAAIEIDLAAEDRRFVQMLVPGGTEKPYGNPIYEPIFEACGPIPYSRFISATRNKASIRHRRRQATSLITSSRAQAVLKG
ncbi:MAG: hypothetical protein K0R28_7250 [Paenibacillus sp.]|jgi:predicted TIM-barrel fold metal-dependent hydrolase|nr:hypothetical protein [Paenibacillus sp.]